MKTSHKQNNSTVATNMEAKINMQDLINYISKVTGFNKKDIEEILQAEREYLIEKGIRETSKAKNH